MSFDCFIFVSSAHTSLSILHCSRAIILFIIINNNNTIINSTHSCLIIFTGTLICECAFHTTHSHTTHTLILHTLSHYTHSHTTHTLILHTLSYYTHSHTTHTLTLHTLSHYTHSSSSAYILHTASEALHSAHMPIHPHHRQRRKPLLTERKRHSTPTHQPSHAATQHLPIRKGWQKRKEHQKTHNASTLPMLSV